MAEEMGMKNIFIFGMLWDDVEKLKRDGYDANKYYNANPELKLCVDQIANGFFSPQNPKEFSHIADILLKWDRFFTLADFDAYIKSQDKVNETYLVGLCGGRIRFDLFIFLDTFKLEVSCNFFLTESRALDKNGNSQYCLIRKILQ